MHEPFIGEIQIFCGMEAPDGWLPCDGRLLSVRDNTPLFAVLGKAFGGDGVREFALPDLRGRVAMQAGAGPGLTLRSLGEPGGLSVVKLDASMLPAHTHEAMANVDAPADSLSSSPIGRVWAYSGNTYSNAEPTKDYALHPGAIRPPGKDEAHNNRQPYLPMTFIIAVRGIFPVRG